MNQPPILLNFLGKIDVNSPSYFEQWDDSLFTYRIL